MGNRYSLIREKNSREIVLLKSFPCKYGKCAFCNYIEDNSMDEEEINRVNIEEIDKITGELGVLEVINSGSVFELPLFTLGKIRQKATEKNINKIYFEAYWAYKNRLGEIRDFFNGIEIVFKVGVETFDEKFRNDVLRKNLHYKSVEEISNYFDSVCIMVGIKGQSREMIKNDIETALKYFKRLTVNVFVDNGTEIKRDEELVKWFEREYAFLDEYEKVEVLNDNKDFGVFEQ
jgi:hypothetical protein